MTEEKKNVADATKTGWIYELRKEGLQEELRKYGLSEEGNVEELRRRLVQLTRRVQDLFTDGGPRTETTPVTLTTEKTPAQVCETVRKWNVAFDGKTDPVAFLERVQEMKRCYNIPDEHLVVAIPELLRGPVLLWYRNTHNAWKTWDNFIADFKDFYLPSNYHLQLTHEISARTQRPGERGRDFIVDLQTLMRRHGEMTEDQELFQLYTNLQPEYRQYIRQRDFHTVGELLQEINNYERLQQEMKPRVNRVAAVSTEATPRQYNSMRVCWRCGKEGHFRSNCRNTAVLFCSRCGKKDIRSCDCPCQGNDKRAGK